jgi:carboxylesterase
VSAPLLEVDSRPFDLGPRKARAGVLVLHGLTGTPYEVRPLGEALARAGMRALGPALPGHNQTPELLARVRHGEWLASARQALETLRQTHAHVAVVGLSLGGLLALTLASEGHVDALAVVATPLRLRVRAPLLPLLPALRRVVPYVHKRRGSDIRDDEARARHPSYDRMPLASVVQLRQLQASVRSKLAKVRAPILIAHGVHDSTAHPDDARAIAAAVGSLERDLLWLPSSGHVVPVDRDGPRLAAAIAAHCVRFLRSIDPPPDDSEASEIQS